MGRRVEIFGVDVDPLDRGDAVGRIIALANDAASALVVTANLDHVVRVRHDPRFRSVYRCAAMVAADGFPLVLASRLSGPRLPERVTGADLIEPICREASRCGHSVFVVGTKLSILSKACRRLAAEYPGLHIAGVHAPSFDFNIGHAQCAEIADMIHAVRPRIVFVALGSPKQELWADASRFRLPPAVFVCVGAGFDYLAGQPPRAPAIVQRLCMEWLWRLAHDPRRLARRYATNLAYLPLLLVEHLAARLRPTPCLSPLKEQKSARISEASISPMKPKGAGSCARGTGSPR